MHKFYVMILNFLFAFGMMWLFILFCGPLTSYQASVYAMLTYLCIMTNLMFWKRKN